MNTSYASTIFISAVLVLSACSGSSNDSDTSSADQTADPSSLTGTLRIQNGLQGRERQALFETSALFMDEFPNVLIEHIDVAPDVHRDTLIDVVSSADSPDVFTWRPGNLSIPLIESGLVEDVSDIWAERELDVFMSSARLTSSHEGKQWSIPITSSSWGIYYRADIFENFSLAEPTTWEEFELVAQTLIDNDIAPLTIGTRFFWPAGGVFDYLNLRVNGYDTYIQHALGEIAYTDDRIRRVFNIWRDMVDSGYFIDGHEDMSWQDAISPLADGGAAMYLMGNFIVPQFEAAVSGSDSAGIARLGYFPFPEIDSNVERSEVAPMESMFISSNANNKLVAKAYLEFLSEPSVQSSWNNTSKQLPVHSGAELLDDAFIAEASETVLNATAVIQFFDRERPRDVADFALEKFQEFMLDTTKMDAVLVELDQAQ